MNFDKEKEEMRFLAERRAVPEHIVDGIVSYVFDGRPPGGFLEAVFSNDLKEAFGRADETNRYAMFHIVSFLYGFVPSECWGSPARMNEWIRFKAEARAREIPG